MRRCPDAPKSWPGQASPGPIGLPGRLNWRHRGFAAGTFPVAPT